MCEGHGFAGAGKYVVELHDRGMEMKVEKEQEKRFIGRRRTEEKNMTYKLIS